jgi:hypothetical protein
MSRDEKAAKARIRIALQKGKELARRAKDLDTCVAVELKVALAAALADDYAALFEEYPDVFPAPPKSPDQVRAGAKELREAQTAAEQAEVESEEATRNLRAQVHELTRPRAKPEKPS